MVMLAQMLASNSGRTVFSVQLDEETGVGTFNVMQDGRTTHTFSTMKEHPMLADKAADLAAREAAVAASLAEPTEMSGATAIEIDAAEWPVSEFDAVPEAVPTA